jgi:hypothetical protein
MFREEKDDDIPFSRTVPKSCYDDIPLCCSKCHERSVSVIFHRKLLKLLCRFCEDLLLEALEQKQQMVVLNETRKNSPNCKSVKLIAIED